MYSGVCDEVVPCRLGNMTCDGQVDRGWVGRRFLVRNDRCGIMHGYNPPSSVDCVGFDGGHRCLAA